MIYRAAAVSSGAGSTTLPTMSLYAGTNRSVRLYLVEVSNTTDVALQVALRRLTTTGTQGSTVSALPDDSDAAAADATVKQTHSGAPTITAGNLHSVQLGAAKGSGWVWVFDRGLYLPSDTAQGIGVVPLDTGQILACSWVWEE